MERGGSAVKGNFQNHFEQNILNAIMILLDFETSASVLHNSTCSGKIRQYRSLCKGTIQTSANNSLLTTSISASKKFSEFLLYGNKFVKRYTFFI